jgi:hypothetical protein
VDDSIVSGRAHDIAVLQRAGCAIAVLSDFFIAVVQIPGNHTRHILANSAAQAVVAFPPMHRTAEYRPSIAEALKAADARMCSVFSFCTCLPV